MQQGESCPFLHGPKPKPAAKPKAAAPENVKATVAVLAETGGVSRASAFRPNVDQDPSTCMQVLKSSVRAFVRPFIALVSIIPSCVHPQGLAQIATLRDGWSSLQCPCAPAVLYHDPHALIAQPKAHDHISLEWIADSGAG